MLSEHMRKVFGYNTWAWQRVFASVEQLDQEAYMAQRLLFSGSIHATLVHAMSAEEVWYQRCHGTSPASLSDPAAYADFDAVFAEWRQVIHKWANFIQWLTDEQCEERIAYKDTRGDDHALPLGDILQHVMNHSTEHRSQITPILADLGVPTAPLDYMVYRLRP